MTNDLMTNANFKSPPSSQGRAVVCTQVGLKGLKHISPGQRAAPPWVGNSPHISPERAKQQTVINTQSHIISPFQGWMKFEDQPRATLRSALGWYVAAPSGRKLVYKQQGHAVLGKGNYFLTTNRGQATVGNHIDRVV